MWEIIWILCTSRIRRMGDVAEWCISRARDDATMAKMKFNESVETKWKNLHATNAKEETGTDDFVHSFQLIYYNFLLLLWNGRCFVRHWVVKSLSLAFCSRREASNGIVLVFFSILWPELREKKEIELKMLVHWPLFAKRKVKVSRKISLSSNPILYAFFMFYSFLIISRFSHLVFADILLLIWAPTLIRRPTLIV